MLSNWICYTIVANFHLTMQSSVIMQPHPDSSESVQSNGEADAIYSTFSMVTDVVYGLATSSGDVHSATIPHQSEIQCALLCNRGEECANFLWDSSNGDCVLDVTWSVEQGQLSTSNTTHLYTPFDSCPSDQGYKLLTSGNSTRCVCLSSFKVMSYINEDECFARGGRLFRANSLSAIQMLQDLATNDMSLPTEWIRIGLDDQQQEGYYVWSDGQKMTQEEYDSLFSPSDPNGSTGENCGAVASNAQMALKLVDISCISNMYYACEMVI